MTRDTAMRGAARGTTAQRWDYGCVHGLGHGRLHIGETRKYLGFLVCWYEMGQDAVDAHAHNKLKPSQADMDRWCNENECRGAWRAPGLERRGIRATHRR